MYEIITPNVMTDLSNGSQVCRILGHVLLLEIRIHRIKMSEVSVQLPFGY